MTPRTPTGPARRFVLSVVTAALLVVAPGVDRSWAQDKQKVSAPPEPAGPPAGPPLKIITYNVQFLPGLASVINRRKHPKYRAVTIGKHLARFDIVALNEVFDDGPRELLLDQLRRAWGKDFNVVLSPKPPGRLSGGCAIVSRLPFLATHSTLYSACSRPEEYGLLADGFAAKGAIHARIARTRTGPDAGFVDVFATHLESKDSKARAVQYAELAEFVRAHSDPKHPTLIMGDLNTHGPVRGKTPEPAYSRMMSLFRRARPAGDVLDLWPHLEPGVGGTSRQTTPTGGSRIDYILLSNPNEGPHRLVPLTVRVNRFLDPRVVALSDHSAVEADLRWGRR